MSLTGSSHGVASCS